MSAGHDANRGALWTAQEMAMLRRAAGRWTADEAATHIPGRSPGAIRRAAARAQIRLRRDYGRHPEPPHAELPAEGRGPAVEPQRVPPLPRIERFRLEAEATALGRQMRESLEARERYRSIRARLDADDVARASALVPQ